MKKRVISSLAMILIGCFLGTSYFYMQRSIPDEYNVVIGEEGRIELPFAVQISEEDSSREVLTAGESNIPDGKVHLTKTMPLCTDHLGNYKLRLNLFGLIHLKEVSVNVQKEKQVMACGAPIGIYLESDGVMVIGTGEITTIDGRKIEPAAGVLESGDYIEQVNGQTVSNKEELVEAINQYGNSGLCLAVRRNKKKIQLNLKPMETTDGDYKLGIWVRSDTQGIGTVTYMDASGNFGALGHGISDTDTGDLMETKKGEVYETAITGIQKATFGNPGVMSGIIYYGPGSHMGTIAKNTEEGIFGSFDDKCKEAFQTEALPIGYRQEVRKGAAVIRSFVSGKQRDYKIEIQKIDNSSDHKNKSLVIKVTDPELIQMTGGIVQGMSGSPIIQNGKLIGAVTHVFVNDPTRGYGIFIENMLENE